MSTTGFLHPSKNQTSGAAPLLPLIAYPFPNFKDHFEAQLKIRDRLFAEVKFRRERQWDTMKWACVMLTGLMTAIITLRTKDIPLDAVTSGCMGIFSLLITVGAIYRIWHDALAAGYYYECCCDLDKAFGVYVDDSEHKFGHLFKIEARAKWHRFLRKAQYVGRVAWLGTPWASKQAVWVALPRPPRIRERSKLSMNGYVKVQALFIASLFVLTLFLLFLCPK